MKKNGLDKAFVADVVKRLSEAQQLIQRGPDRKGYRVGGKLLTSVSALIDILDKPALKYWAARTQQAADQRAIEDWLSRGQVGSIGSALAGVKDAFQSVGRAARDIGTEAHSVIEHLMRVQMGKLPKDAEPPPVSTTAAFVVSAHRRWAEEHEFSPIAVETKIYSEKDGVAGQLDMLAIVPKHPLLAGKLVIVDHKSSKEIYEESILQVNTYVGIFSKLLGLNPGEQVAGLVVRLPKDPGEPEQRPILWDADCYRAVTSLRHMVQWRRR